ncbi:MAG: hypothetical protein AB7F43_01835 [Bacteriovoracia bacterium]
MSTLRLFVALLLIAFSQPLLADSTEDQIFKCYDKARHSSMADNHACAMPLVLTLAPDRVPAVMQRIQDYHNTEPHWHHGPVCACGKDLLLDYAKKKVFDLKLEDALILGRAISNNYFGAYNIFYPADAVDHGTAKHILLYFYAHTNIEHLDWDDFTKLAEESMTEMIQRPGLRKIHDEFLLLPFHHKTKGAWLSRSVIKGVPRLFFKPERVRPYLVKMLPWYRLKESDLDWGGSTPDDKSDYWDGAPYFTHFEFESGHPIKAANGESYCHAAPHDAQLRIGKYMDFLPCKMVQDVLEQRFDLKNRQVVRYGNFQDGDVYVLGSDEFPLEENLFDSFARENAKLPSPQTYVPLAETLARPAAEAFLRGECKEYRSGDHLSFWAFRAILQHERGYPSGNEFLSKILTEMRNLSGDQSYTFSQGTETEYAILLKKGTKPILEFEFMDAVPVYRCVRKY